MKKRIVGIIILIAVLAGCGANETADSSIAEKAELEESQEEPAPAGRTEQEFKNMNLEISQGTLYIRNGEEFAVNQSERGSGEYEIHDNTLYFESAAGAETELILPEGEEYQNLQLHIKDAHVYIEDGLNLQNLELELEQGDAKLEKLSVLGESDIYIRKGSAALTGDLGEKAYLSCAEGKLSIKTFLRRIDYDYEITVSAGDVRLDGDTYHGRRDTWSEDNEADRSMTIECDRGDLEVEFEKEETGWNYGKKGK